MTFQFKLNIEKLKRCQYLRAHSKSTSDSQIGIKNHKKDLESWLKMPSLTDRSKTSPYHRSAFCNRNSWFLYIFIFSTHNPFQGKRPRSHTLYGAAVTLQPSMIRLSHYYHYSRVRFPFDFPIPIIRTRTARQAHGHYFLERNHPSLRISSHL